MLEHLWRLGRRVDRSLRPTTGEDPTLLYRIAICLCVAFAIAASVKMVASPTDHNNYVVFEAAGRAWLAGGDLYDSPPDLEFRYLPPFAAALAPLAMAPSRVGALLWIWLNLGAFYWSLRVLIRDILPNRFTVNQEGAFLLLTLLGAYRVFWCAQTNLLIFAMVVAAMHAILYERWNWAALLLALPVYVKLWPLAPAVLLVACWPRRLAWRFGCALAAIAAAPFLTQRWSFVAGQYSEFCLALIGKMQVRHDYRDAWTAWELIQKPVSAPGYLALQLATALGLWALVMWLRRSRAMDQALLTFILGAWCAWQLTFGPGTERATFGLIAPLTAWALLTAYARGFGFAAISVAFGLSFLATIGQVERSLAPAYPWVLIAHPAAMILFALWLVAYARREFVLCESTERCVAGQLAAPSLASRIWTL